MENEIWKDIPDYEGFYQVSNLGRVKSLNRSYVDAMGRNRPLNGRILRQKLTRFGYLDASLSVGGKMRSIRVHQLVAMAFLGHSRCGYKLVVNHKNFIKTDNRVENLEIVSTRENSNRKHLKSTSEYTGVHWRKQSNKWHAQIIVDGKKLHIGLFDTELEASQYYENAVVAIENGTEIQVKRVPTASKYKGVVWDKVRNRWRATIQINGKTKYIKIFKTEDEAHQAILDYKKLMNL